MHAAAAAFSAAMRTEAVGQFSNGRVEQELGASGEATGRGQEEGRGRGVSTAELLDKLDLRLDGVCQLAHGYTSI